MAKRSTDTDRENEVRTFLKAAGWPQGLQNTFLRIKNKIPKRYFICDDSYTMTFSDGKILQGNSMVSCSRWKELAQTLLFHAELAHIAKAETEFRFLNKSKSITVGVENDNTDKEFNLLKEMLNKDPDGETPIGKVLDEVAKEIKDKQAELEKNKQLVCIVIATDGVDSDYTTGEIANKMKEMSKLPVWFVVRLCTDDEDVVKEWNNIDRIVEERLDVLDDILTENKQVVERNPWLNYALPLHQIREFGISIKVFDKIDEKALTPEEIVEFCAHLLGGERGTYNSPYGKIDDLMRAIAFVQEKYGITEIYNPGVKTGKNHLQPWINTEKLKKLFEKAQEEGNKEMKETR